MSLVGPRPERPVIAEQLQRDVPGFADRLSVRPGLTGLAQMQFPPDTNLDSVCRKLVADLGYTRVGPTLDFRILVATVLYLLHFPLAWRRAVLGKYAEPRPASEPGPLTGLAAVYELPRKEGRVVALQGLRGVAAALIFLTHFIALFGVYLGGAATGWWGRSLELLARTGTDVFLMISGFLIYGMAIRKPLAYGTFLTARMRKIYPPFLCVFGLYLLLSIAFPSESKIPSDPGDAAIFLLQNVALLPGLIGTTAMITVTWTLGYELLLYVTVPALVRYTGMRNWPRAARLACLSLAWVGYLVYCGTVSPAHVRLSIYFAAFLAYEVIGTRRESPSRRSELCGGLALVLGLAAVVLLRSGLSFIPDLGTSGLNAVLRAGALAVGLFGLAWCCFGGAGVLGRALCWTPLQCFGNMSYSFYLLHGLVLKCAILVFAAVLPAATGGAVVFWVALPICFAAAAAVSTILFVFVEKPMYRTARPALVADQTSETVDLSWGTDTVVEFSSLQSTVRVDPSAVTGGELVAPVSDSPNRSR